MTISQRVFYLLGKQGKKQNELAEYTGIPTSTISAWNKRGTNPAADTISTIADFFEVSTDYLLTGEEKISPEIKLTDIEKCLLLDFRSLSSQGKDYIRQQMFIAREVYKKQDISEADLNVG